MMHQSQVLDEDETVILELVIGQDEVNVTAAFSNYEKNKDVFELATMLKKIAFAAGQLLGETGEEEEEVGGLKSGDMGRGGAESDEDSSSSDENLDESSAYDVFLQQVEEMKLDAMETAALRLCISRNDPSLQGALEAYRMTTDGDDLKDSLRRIIKVTIQGVGAEQQNENQNSNQNQNSNEATDKNTKTANAATSAAVEKTGESDNVDKFSPMEVSVIVKWTRRDEKNNTDLN